MGQVSACVPLLVWGVTRRVMEPVKDLPAGGRFSSHYLSTLYFLPVL